MQISPITTTGPTPSPEGRAEFIEAEAISALVDQKPQSFFEQYLLSQQVQGSDCSSLHDLTTEITLEAEKDAGETPQSEIDPDALDQTFEVDIASADAPHLWETQAIDQSHAAIASQINKKIENLGATIDELVIPDRNVPRSAVEGKLVVSIEPVHLSGSKRPEQAETKPAQNSPIGTFKTDKALDGSTVANSVEVEPAANAPDQSKATFTTQATPKTNDGAVQSIPAGPAPIQSFSKDLANKQELVRSSALGETSSDQSLRNSSPHTSKPNDGKPAPRPAHSFPFSTDKSSAQITSPEDAASMPRSKETFPISPDEGQSIEPSRSELPLLRSNLVSPTSQSAPYHANSPPQIQRPFPVSNVHTIVDAALTLKDTGGQIDVSLSPEDLGKLTIKFDQAVNGPQLTLFAERPDTQDAMRRQMELLQAQFREMGFDNLSFAFDQNPGNANSAEGNGADANGNPEKIEHFEFEASVGHTALVGLDIRI